MCITKAACLWQEHFFLQESESEEEEEKVDGKEGSLAGPKHIDTEKQMLELAEAASAGKEKGKGKKRGGEEVMERIAEKKRKAAEQAEAQKHWFDLKVNTSVYVTGLPDDVDESQLAEVKQLFSLLQLHMKSQTLFHLKSY